MPIRHVLASAAVALLALAPAASADTLTGGAGRDLLTGRDTASAINGKGGNDLLYGDPVAGMGAPRAMQRVGGAGAQHTEEPSFTADGRTMLFRSSAPEFFPPGKANGLYQVFTRDMVTGVVTLVTVDAQGEPFNEHVNGVPALSPNGRFAAVSSNATNIPGVPLPSGPTNQIILKDLRSGIFTLVTQTPFGAPGSSSSGNPVFSPDGKMLAFESTANDLDHYDTNNTSDVFVVRLSEPSKVYRASTTANGAVATGGGSYLPQFSPDSKTLAFESYATNLRMPATDANPFGKDIYLKALGTLHEGGRVIIGEVTLANSSAGNVQNSTGGSFGAAFSPDGREIAFVSEASSLVLGDTTIQGAGASGRDIFIKTIRDGVPGRPKGTIGIVSRSSTGQQGIGFFNDIRFSPDGTRLAFSTNAANLASGATGQQDQVLVKDLTVAGDKGAVTLVSRNTATGGAQGNFNSWSPTFIGHGDRLAFVSAATNLVPGDGNNRADIFIATLGAPAGGADAISGGGGRDVIVGGPGADRLRGGKGADRFVYLSTADSGPGRRDTILDFNGKQGDVIDLSAIDANTKVAGNQAFTFIGARRFDGKPGRLRFAGGILSADTTGNRKANFAIRVQVTGGKLTGKRIVK